MRYPEFLKNGGRIGFIAPSFGCSRSPYAERFSGALKFFKAQGYECVLGPNCYEDKGFGKSNSPMLCGEEINDFLCNDRSDIVISCGGGETMCEDLDYVDFERIKSSPAKWYMGYSDNTNLVYTLSVLCDIAAIYGPCAPSFGLRKLHPALKDALLLLKGEKLSLKNYDGWQADEDDREYPPDEPYRINRPFSMKTFIADRSVTEDVSFSGRLIGGCLDILGVICGSRYDATRQFNERYKSDGAVWFLESCNLTSMDTLRTLWKLDSAGWFETAKGFLIGRPYEYGNEDFGLSQYDAALRILFKYKVPVIMDLDIGHLPPMMPLISGAYCTAGTKSGEFFINMALK